MEKFIKVVELFETIGYATKDARGQATRAIKVAVPRLEKIAKVTDILTVEETKAILKGIATSKSSKYKAQAMDLLTDEKFLAVEGIITEDGNYIAPKKTKTAKAKILKSHLEAFIKAKGLEDELTEWMVEQD